MLVDLFRDELFFPFSDYATDIQHFIGAQRYWLALLRAVPEFVEADWHPVLRAVDVAADQASGLMLRLQDTTNSRLLSLHTNSFEGCTAELLADNPPMTPKQIAEAKEKFEWKPDKAAISGITREHAIREAGMIYVAFTAQAEPAEIYVPDAGHPEGGYLLPARRLVLLSEVSRDCEPQAQEALSRFLKEPARRLDRSAPQT